MGGVTELRPSKGMTRTLGKYELITRIAIGGMAEVFLARQRGYHNFRKLVVVKAVHPHLASEREFIDMLLDEARISALIKHPRVVDIYDLGHENETYFIAMEYLPGQPLTELLKIGVKRRKLDIYSTVRVLADVADGLHAAHNLKTLAGEPLELVHRDVSPGNIMVLYDGNVKLVDFGVSKARGRLSQTGVSKVKGKIGYAAPEQVCGEPIDRRTDIYSLGVVMWEALTHKRLFVADSQKTALSKMMAGPPPPPSLFRHETPRELDQVCLRALAVDSKDRYQSAAEMRKDLELYLRAANYYRESNAIAEYMEDMFAHCRREQEELIRSAAEGTKQRVMPAAPPPDFAGEDDDPVVDPPPAAAVPAAAAPVPPPPAADAGGRVVSGRSLLHLPKRTPTPFSEDEHTDVDQAVAQAEPIVIGEFITDDTARRHSPPVKEQRVVLATDIVDAIRRRSPRTRRLLLGVAAALALAGAAAIGAIAVSAGDGDQAERAPAAAAAADTRPAAPAPSAAETEAKAAPAPVAAAPEPEPPPAPEPEPAAAAEPDDGLEIDERALLEDVQVEPEAEAVEPEPEPEPEPARPSRADKREARAAKRERAAERSAPPPAPAQPRTDEEEQDSPRERDDAATPAPAQLRDRARTAYQAGVKLFVSGKLAGAKQKFGEALRFHPGYALPHRGLGLVYEREGNQSKAARSFKKYLKMAPRAQDADQIRARLKRLGG